ncbi:hypothetical protein AHAS_Ahas18G0195900 [Arachis hypogaea]
MKFLSLSMVLMSSLFSTYKHFSHTSLYKSSPLFIVLNPINWLRCGSIQKQKM